MGPYDEEGEPLLVALAAAAGVAFDKARLYEEARRKERWLRATAEVTHELLSGTESTQVLALVTKQALELSGADLVALAVPTGGGQRLGGMPSARARARRAAKRKAVAARARGPPRLVIVGDGLEPLLARLLGIVIEGHRRVGQVVEEGCAVRMPESGLTVENRIAESSPCRPHGRTADEHRGLCRGGRARAQ